MPAITELTDGPLVDAIARLLADDPTDPVHDGASAPPGALVAVSRGDAVAYAVGGEAQRGRTPMSWDARTDAGSVTKVVATTAAVMGLVDDGQLAIDDPVSRYLPGLAGRDATVQDLLEHRAGLWEWWPLYLSARGEAAVRKAASLPLRYPPRAARHYSDLGFVLLGALLSRVAGCPLDQAVQHLAFARFGLTTTRYARPSTGGPVIASSHGDIIEQTMIDSGVPYPVEGRSSEFDRWRTHDLVGEVNDGNSFHAFGGVAGHAGVFTTAADLLEFSSAMLKSLHGEGPISAATARRFVAAGADPSQGLGLRIWDDGSSPVVGHGGFPGVAFGFQPDTDASMVLITNRLHADGPPCATEPMWALARGAAREQLASVR